MLIQKQIEDNLVTYLRTAFASAGITNAAIDSAWASCDTGFVKWTEDSSTSYPVFVSVSFGGPAYRAFSLDEANITASITVYDRTELDPTGASILAVIEEIEGCTRTLTTSVGMASTLLDAETFSVDAFTCGGSSAPANESGIVSVSFPITISGSFREPQPATVNNGGTDNGIQGED